MPFGSAVAQPACTLVARSDTGETLVEEGDCDRRATPASTFKLPLAVIGFDTRALTSPETPAVDFDPDRHVAWIENWKATTTPRTWLRDSVVWYSWEVTRPLGLEGMETYLERFNYGNQDMSGTAGEDNGITHAWLSSSLAVSPREQIAFLSKLMMRSLPVKVSSQQLAIETTASYEFGDNQLAKGKTGNGFARGTDGTLMRDRQVGWFIGWTNDWPKGENVPEDTPLVFARLILDEGPTEGYASFRARDSLLADLPRYLGIPD
ncbi:MAG: penicillin-binding transpeptidase domain-containing protein [Pseudomonadota bacterium]